VGIIDFIDSISDKYLRDILVAYLIINALQYGPSKYCNSIPCISILSHNIAQDSLYMHNEQY